MIESQHPALPITRQCELPGLARASLSPARAGIGRELAPDARHRRDVSGVSGLWLAADDALAAAARPRGESSTPSSGSTTSSSPTAPSAWPAPKHRWKSISSPSHFIWQGCAGWPPAAHVAS